MRRTRFNQSAFTAGVLGRALEGRADLDAYAIGARALRNCLPRVQGYTQSRPGSRYVESLPAGYTARLLPFNFNAEQTYTVAVIADAVGAGSGAIRFYRDGGVLLDPTTGPPLTRYEISSDYTAAELPTLGFFQSADVLYITCPTKPLRELRRLADSVSSVSWSLVDSDLRDGPYGDLNDSTTTIVLAGTVTAGNTVTATASADLFVSTDVGRAVRIRKSDNTGAWGWGVISAFTSATEVSVDVEADFNADLTSNASTHWRLGAFSDTTGYPRCGAFFEGRMALGATASRPQTVFTSAAGDITAFAPTVAADDSVPDDQAITLDIDDDRVNRIEWLLPAAGSLLAGTSGGEFVIRARSSGGADPISPSNAAAFRQTAYGSAASVNALKVGPAALFVQRGSGDTDATRSGGRRLREMVFRFDEDQYIAEDQTLRCGELTHAAPETRAADLAGAAGRGSSGAGGIIELALQTVPATRAWALRADGVLLPYDYEPGQSVRAWTDQVIAGSCPDWLSRQPGLTVDGEPASRVPGVQAALTGARVRSIATIRDDDSAQDQLWMIVERVVDGSTVRSVEYLLPEPELSWRAGDGVHLDGSVSSSGWDTTDTTLSVVVDSGGVATVTASASIFTAGDVGVLLGLQSDADAAGLDPAPIAFARIASYSSGTVVVLEDGHGLEAGSTTVFNRWGVAIESTVSGLDHLVGETVVIIADGGVDGRRTVSASGTATLTAPAMVVHAGLEPAVIVRTMPVVAAGENFTSVGRKVNITGGRVRLLRSAAVRASLVGTTDGRAAQTASDQSPIPGRDPAAGTNRSQAPASGWFDLRQTLGPCEDIQVEIRPAEPLTMRLVGLALDVGVQD